MNREWYDTVLIAIFIIFATYKAVRIRKTNHLGWSFATYNAVMAFLFFVSVFFLSWVEWDWRLESAILSLGRLSIVIAIIWCVIEVELARRRDSLAQRDDL